MKVKQVVSKLSSPKRNYSTFEHACFDFESCCNISILYNKRCNKCHSDDQPLSMIFHPPTVKRGELGGHFKNANNLNSLDSFLENEKNNNVNEPWSKLDKTIKTKKLLEFVDIYKKANELTDEDEKILVHFFKDCLDRKKLNRVKDVIYDKTTGLIKDIPGLFHNKVKMFMILL